MPTIFRFQCQTYAPVGFWGGASNIWTCSVWGGAAFSHTAENPSNTLDETKHPYLYFLGLRSLRPVYAMPKPSPPGSE